MSYPADNRSRKSGGGGNRTRATSHAESPELQRKRERCDEAWKKYERSHVLQLQLDAYASLTPLSVGTRTNLYFIYDERGDVFKVGLAKDVRARLSTLQQASYRPLFCFTAVPGNRALERFVHAFLASERKAGEWFGGELTDAVAVEFRGIEQTLCDMAAAVDEDEAVDFKTTLACLTSRIEDAMWREVA